MAAGSVLGRAPATQSRAVAMPRVCAVDLCRRERPSGGMHRKAEEEPMVELLATTTTQRGPTRLPIPPSLVAAQQAGDPRGAPLLVAEPARVIEPTQVAD